MIPRLHPLPLLLASLALGTPAVAQDAALCGGIGAVGTWAGGSAETSDITTATGPFDGWGLVPLGGHLVYMFTTSAPTDVRVEVKPQGEGDTVLQLFDAGGTMVLEDDDGGGALASRAETTLDAGTYCLSARSFETRPLDVELRIGQLSHPAITSGATDGGGDPSMDCTPETDALTLGAGLLTSDILDATVTQSTTGDSPAFYRFSLAEPMGLTIRATGDTADPMIALFDAGGAGLGENDDFDGLNAQLDLTAPLPAGSYCLAVRDLNDSGTPIALGLSRYDPVAARAGMIDRAELAPLPSDNTAITDLGAITGALTGDHMLTGPAQWFSVEVPAAGLLLIDAIGIGGSDPVLTLFDDAGRQISSVDDSNGTLDAQLIHRAAPGRYLVALRLVDGSTGSVRMVLERFVPAQ